MTLALSLAAVHLRKISRFNLPAAIVNNSEISSSVSTSSVAATAASERLLRCEPPELPLWMQRRLNRSFPGWKFPEISEDDCQDVKNWRGPKAYAQLIRGDFDGDDRLDYAVLIAKGELTDDRGIVYPVRIYIVSFLRKAQGYKMRVVTREGGGSLQLMRKGDRDYDYDAQREFNYKYDTIMSGEGMGGMSYLYENGKFRAIITSD